MTYTPMFEIWTVEEDGRTFEVALDLGRGDEYPLATHGWFFGVRVPMAHRKDNGLASEEERVRLDAVENRIRGVLRERDAVYVGRRTGDSNRDLMFYTGARPRGVEERIKASIGMEILFMNREDRHWQGYESMLPRERHWRQIEDRKTINALVNAGSDPEKTHQIEYRVETSLAKGAEALERFFEKLELRDITVSGSAPSIMVSGIQDSPLHVDTIHRISWHMEAKAPKARGKYLGWFADPALDEDDGLDLLSEVDDLEALLSRIVEESGEG